MKQIVKDVSPMLLSVKDHEKREEYIGYTARELQINERVAGGKPYSSCCFRNNVSIRVK